MTIELAYRDGLTPPSAERVAKRAIVLASCVYRATLEDASKDPAAHEMHGNVLEWLDEIGVCDEFEPKEWSEIAADLGTLTMRSRMGLGWRTEGMAVLAWALRRIDLPASDE